jgi:hypothetical protein
LTEAWAEVVSGNNVGIQTAVQIAQMTPAEQDAITTGMPLILSNYLRLQIRMLP